MSGSPRILLALDDINLYRASNFFNIYDEQGSGGSEDRKTLIGSKSPRKCRFCKKTDEEVSFKKKAHVLPQFTGNRYLMSYFECDECNGNFSSYEDSFSKFIGITRTIHQIKGQSSTKFPKFKNLKTDLELSVGDKGLRLVVQEDSNEFEIDENNKTLKIKTIRHPYTPIHIPKSLLKMGFCFLNEDELESYERIREFLADENGLIDVEGDPIFHVYGYSIPGPTYFEKPSAILYTKKESQQAVHAPEKQIVFHFANYIFQIPLIGAKDKWLVGKKAQIPIYPLFIDNSYFERYGNYQSLNLNLTSSKKKQDEPHVITFSIDSVIYNNS